MDEQEDHMDGFPKSITAIYSINNPPTTPIVTSPNGGEIWKGIHDITWTASTDPDGDQITYEIEYSRDGGVNWEPLDSGISETSYPWDTTAYPDSAKYLIRVRAYDGCPYSDWDQTDNVFTVDNTPPITRVSHAAGSSIITLTASDATSGVKVTYYSIDSEPWNRYIQAISLTGTGSHTVNCYSEDKAGNTEAPPKSLTIHSLTIAVSPLEGGSTSPAPGTYWYNAGMSVTVSETPASEYFFDHWDLDGSNVGSSPSYRVKMNDPHTLTASFKLQTPTYDVTIKAHCSNEGVDITVSFNWDGTPCTTPKTFTGQTGSHTVVIAKNDANFHPFIKWVKDGKDYSTSMSVTISSGGTYRAIYSAQIYNVHLESKQDTGTTENLGTISFDGVTIPLPTDISKGAGSYRATYNAAPSYKFEKWENDGGVSVSDPHAQTTTVNVTGNGILRAICTYASVTVHDLAVADVHTYPASPTVGQDITITVTVKNEGDQTETNVPVKAYVDGSQVGSTQHVTLSPGESLTLSFLWTPDKAKKYSIRGEIGVASGETDTADNTKTTSVTVEPAVNQPRLPKPIPIEAIIILLQ